MLFKLGSQMRPAFSFFLSALRMSLPTSRNSKNEESLRLGVPYLSRLLVDLVSSCLCQLDLLRHLGDAVQEGVVNRILRPADVSEARRLEVARMHVLDEVHPRLLEAVDNLVGLRQERSPSLQASHVRQVIKDGGSWLHMLDVLAARHQRDRLLVVQGWIQHVAAQPAELPCACASFRLARYMHTTGGALSERVSSQECFALQANTRASRWPPLLCFAVLAGPRGLSDRARVLPADAPPALQRPADA
eukprot:767175-Hanusia_phi.AAC.10